MNSMVLSISCGVKLASTFSFTRRLVPYNYSNDASWTSQIEAGAGAGVIWNGGSTRAAGHSRPAIAGGIQPDDSTFPTVCGVDSRPSASSGQAFRGNDCGLERPCLANDTSIRVREIFVQAGGIKNSVVCTARDSRARASTFKHGRPARDGHRTCSYTTGPCTARRSGVCYRSAGK
jgi:hypothetical protein